MSSSKTTVKTKQSTYKLTASLTKQQHRGLDQIFRASATLYNACMESWRGTYEWHQRHHAYDDVSAPSSSYFDNAALFAQMRKDDPFWNQLASDVGRGVLKRFHKSIDDFYKRCKTPGKKPGYPRYKSGARWRSFEIVGAHRHHLRNPQTKKNQSSRWWRLDVKGVPKVRFLDGAGRLAEALEVGDVCTIRLVRTALRVELHVVVKLPVPEILEATNPVGIDPGIKKRFTYHDGTEIEKRTLDRAAQKRKQRKLSRTKKDSNGRVKARKAHAKECARVTVRAHDEDFRLADEIVKSYDGVAFEICNIQGLSQTKRFSRTLSEQRWAAFADILQHKAEKAGQQFKPVDARRACTQTCYMCGRRQKMPVDIRVYDCPKCGWSCERDRHAALNIRAFGFPEAERPGGVVPGGLRDINFVSGVSVSAAARDATAQNSVEAENPF